MQIKFLNNNYQRFLNAPILKKVSEIFDSGYFVEGKYVKEFEEKFADFCGAKYCIAVNNGTAALYLSLLYYKEYINLANTRVYTPSNSFIATSEAISAVGKNPTFVDCGYDDGNIRINNIELFNGDIVVPVSLWGNPCDLVGLQKKKGRYNFIIHDNSQGVGNKINGEPTSKYCDLETYSFYPGKNLGSCGEGGAIVTNDKNFYEWAQMVKNHGAKEKYKHEIIGTNLRFNEIGAVCLLEKLKYIKEWNESRNEIATIYNSYLSQFVDCLYVEKNNYNVWHQFPVFIQNRDVIKQELLDRNIECGIHYPIPIHKSEAYKKWGRYFDLPNTDLICSTELSLPIYPGMTREEILYVCFYLAELNGKYNNLN